MACGILLLVFGSTLRAADAETGARRDAVVRAVEQVMPAVVNIATEEIVPRRDRGEDFFREFFDRYYRRRAPNTQYSLGSGFIIDEEGFLLTNFHVVSRARRIWVRLQDGRQFEAERVSGTAFTDLALLKMQTEEGESFTAVPFADDDDLLLGETVVALGNPFGLGGSVSRGILSSKSRRPENADASMDYQDWLQTDAAINPGNSGGPLINLDGELIGINVAVHREGQGIGFAIPIKRVSQALSDIYSPEWLRDLWFGATVKPGSDPLVVTAVERESPAGRAGLRARDEILKIDGEKPEGFIDFNRRLIKAGAERDVALEYRRGGTTRTMELRLVPEETFFNEDLIRRKTGASLQALTPELAEAFGLRGLNGLLVAGVDEDSPAAAIQLDRGMVVTAIDGQPMVEVLPAARFLYGKAAGDKVTMEVVVPRRSGAFIALRQVAVEITIQ